MSQPINVDQRIDEILMRDHRYPREAYYFIMGALSYTRDSLERPRHVSGQELCMGIRDFALEQFGIATLLVFEQWGIKRTRDFGELVFNLIDVELMLKTDQDRIEDFEDVYDFMEAFGRNYQIVVDKSQI